jgi:NarL family two-component system response regulator LiaR
MMEDCMNTSDPIRVLIVDDHGMVRRGLAAYMNNAPDIAVVGEARDGQEAVELCEQVQPDVILMDLVMPGMSGAEATRVIRQRWPKVQVIALTSFQERELVQEVLRAGAISYLLKNVSGDELAGAIRAALAGRATLAPEAIQALVRPSELDALPDPGLTQRELEVLALLVEGLNNPEIAERLSISRSTVKAHVSNILSKLGASSRSMAVALAIQHELLARSTHQLTTSTMSHIPH